MTAVQWIDGPTPQPFVSFFYMVNDRRIDVAPNISPPRTQDPPNPAPPGEVANGENPSARTTSCQSDILGCGNNSSITAEPQAPACVAGQTGGINGQAAAPCGVPRLPSLQNESSYAATEGNRRISTPLAESLLATRVTTNVHDFELVMGEIYAEAHETGVDVLLVGGSAAIGVLIGLGVREFTYRVFDETPGAALYELIHN